MSWRGPIHSPKSRHNPKESKETANKNQTKHKTQPKHQQTTKQQKQERESDRLASSAMSTKRWGVITLYHPYIGYGGKTNKADQKNNITNIAIPGLWVKQHSTMRKPGLPLPGARDHIEQAVRAWKLTGLQSSYQQRLCRVATEKVKQRKVKQRVNQT